MSELTKDQLWQKAKGLKKDLGKTEFDQALAQYVSQHHTLPQKMEVVDIAGLDPQVKVVVTVGKVNGIEYTPAAKSRKGDHDYRHDTKKEFLGTDAQGKMLILFGKTYMSRRGWLED